jgi:hypothetical protein
VIIITKISAATTVQQLWVENTLWWKCRVQEITLETWSWVRICSSLLSCKKKTMLLSVLCPSALLSFTFHHVCLAAG